MSDILYSKLRLEVPQSLDGEDATITSSRGATRTVEMSSPVTDVMVAGMEKYRVQAGETDEEVKLGYGQIRKSSVAGVSALNVTTMPTKTRYLVGETLDLTGAVIKAAIEKGDGSTEPAKTVTSQCTFDPANGDTLNTQGTQRVDVEYENASQVVSTSFNVDVVVRSMLKKLPYNTYGGAAIVLNGEIHILGSGASSSVTRKYHYKWDGTSWVSVSTLPYDFYQGSAVVLNNEIHILGGSQNETKHYKWNGSEWVSVSTLPYNMYGGTAVVLNGEIHILGGYNGKTKHYKWNGTSWSSVSTLPHNFYYGCAVVLSNEIHILGGNASNTKHYKYNGSTWSSVSTLPYEFDSSCAVVLNGEIHILGSGKVSGSSPNYTYPNATKHYKRNSSGWSEVSTLPYGLRFGASVVWNSGGTNEIAILGTITSGYQNYDAQWDGTTWTVGSDS